MKIISLYVLCILSCLFVLEAVAQPAFTGMDYSGVYECTGKDSKEGDYTGKVTLKLKPEHSTATYASYEFTLEVPGFGKYPGYAAAHGNQFAIHFALTDQSTKDYGVGLATFKTNKQGKASFHKFYFEPEFKGGNTGTEDCVRK
ncbi:hypothetical protein A7981_07250 [Methylovorus sp. MM2]|uniref:hypothetical protein n=1 Tax=Methylovorus sp. MM2 TaxID=1848038 RepID=UPI0007E11426|nr:hypothetical protein [Methylovorus sp. MM2]OAM53191.1 hypothetical protein A7981_07250 [Methylovorus sp. MM2]